MAAVCGTIFIVSSALLFISGCGYKNSSNYSPPIPVDNSGSWAGSLQVPSLASGGDINMAIVQTGTNIKSTRLLISSLIGPPDCGSSGTMTGTINSSNVSMAITESTGDVLTMTGTIASGAINGTYTSSGTCTAGISGTFNFGLVPSITSTQWSGTISGTATTGFTVSLTEDKDANLTGMLQFAGTACPNPISVSGTVTGEHVYFDDGLGGQIQADGMITDSEGKSINGTATGTCTSGDGGLTLTRP